MKSKTLVIVAGLFTSVSLSHATPITISDFSFEGITATVSSPSTLGVGIIGTNTGPIGAWSASSGASIGGLLGSVSSGTATSLGAPAGADGSYVARINLPSGVGASVDLSQSLASSFLANSIYTLSFEIDAGSTATLLSGSSMSLTAGSTDVATLSGTTFTSLLDGNNDFQTLNLTYQTGNTPPVGVIGIDFDANSTAGAGGNFYLDNFQLGVTPTPEPSTLALLSLGALFFFGCSKFQKHKAASALKESMKCPGGLFQRNRIS
jgi:hapalindole biogenesis HpiC1 cyclase-like protein/PEP-CTERM motif-containing protein